MLEISFWKLFLACVSLFVDPQIMIANHKQLIIWMFAKTKAIFLQKYTKTEKDCSDFMLYENV